MFLTFETETKSDRLEKISVYKIWNKTNLSKLKKAILKKPTISKVQTKCSLFFAISGQICFNFSKCMSLCHTHLIDLWTRAY